MNRSTSSTQQQDQSGESTKTTMVVRLHSGAARKLSVTSNAGTGTQTSEFVNGEMNQTNGTYSASQQHQSQTLKTTTYMAEIHNVESSETTSSSAATCFASGLEITFESLPQTIDIRLIPENDADSAPGTVSTATHAVANITSGGVNVVNRTATAGSATNGIHQASAVAADQVMRSSKSDLSLSHESLPVVDGGGNKTRQ